MSPQLTETKLCNQLCYIGTVSFSCWRKNLEIGKTSYRKVGEKKTTKFAKNKIDKIDKEKQQKRKSFAPLRPVGPECDDTKAQRFDPAEDEDFVLLFARGFLRHGFRVMFPLTT